MQKRILLINAINSIVEVQQRQPSLGLGYLVSVLRKHFGRDYFSFRIIDRNIENEVKQFNPDVVLISSVTQNFGIASTYAKYIKGLGIPIIIGGVHITMIPSNVSNDFDVGVMGEGEEAIIDLMEVFLSKGEFLPDDLDRIKGIVFSDHGAIHKTEERQQINDLDSIPKPARDLLRINMHTYMFSSRGCPYKCIFCSSTRFWNKVRFFSAGYVIEEIRDLVDNYNVKLISFYDDLFIADRQRLRAIVSLIKKDKRLKKVSFTCNGRANIINDEVVALLKEMNVLSVNLGLESGCENTLRFLKHQVTLQQNLNAVKTVKRHGLSCNGSFIIGSPQETKEEMLETYKFIKKLHINLTDIYVLTPYPGTPIWDYAKKRGLVSENMEWSKLDVNFQNNFESAVILSEVMGRKEIIKIFKKFYRLRFFKNLVGILTHPYLIDLPKTAIRLLTEKINLKFKKKLK